MNRVFPISFSHWIKWVTHSAHHSQEREKKSFRSVWKRHFCLLSQTKNKTDTSWAVLSDESLKIAQIFCTKALLYCVLYSLYRKTVQWPGWSKISVYSYCGDLHGGPAPVTESLHKRALEIHHRAMHVEMRADSVGDHVALFLARKSHLKRNLSVACRGLFWKMQKKKS